MGQEQSYRRRPVSLQEFTAQGIPKMVDAVELMAKATIDLKILSTIVIVTTVCVSIVLAIYRYQKVKKKHTLESYLKGTQHIPGHRHLRDEHRLRSVQVHQGWEQRPREEKRDSESSLGIGIALSALLGFAGVTRSYRDSDHDGENESGSHHRMRAGGLLLAGSSSSSSLDDLYRHSSSSSESGHWADSFDYGDESDDGNYYDDDDEDDDDDGYSYGNDDDWMGDGDDAPFGGFEYEEDDGW